MSTLAIIPILVLSIAGCGGETDPTTTAPSTPFEQLQAKVSTVETKVKGLETAIANIPSSAAQITAINSSITAIKASVATLQTTVSGLSATDLTSIEGSIADLESQASDVGDSITNLNSGSDVFTADIEAIRTSLVAISLDIADLQDQITNLVIPDGLNYDTEIATLQTSLGLLTSRVAAVESNIVTIEANLLSTANYVTTLETSLTLLNARIIALEQQYSGMPRVIIDSSFTSGANNLKFIAKTSGDYIVILTTYYSSASTPTIYSTIPSATTLVKKSYTYGGSNNWMLVTILYLKDSTTGNPENWQVNDEVIIVFTENIEYTTITTGVR